MNKRIVQLLVVLAVVAVAVTGAFIFIGDDTATDSQAATTTGTFPEPGLVSPATYQQQFAEADVAHFLVDVRTPAEFAAGHIEGAVNIPLSEIQSGRGLSQIPADQNVVVYCRSGNRSGTARSLLQQAGINNVYDIDGGTIAWSSAGYPLQ